jgi:hypothetical protein
MLKAMMILYRHPGNERSAPGQVGSTMLLSEQGVDLATQWGMTFPKIKAMANCELPVLPRTDVSSARPKHLEADPQAPSLLLQTANLNMSAGLLVP